jgi:hypothetical protein
MQLGVFEQLIRCFFILVPFFTYPVPQYLQYTSGKAMLHSLP